MNDERRGFLKFAGAMTAGAAFVGAGAIAGRATDRRLATRKYNFTLPQVSAERVLRTQVGLRPHRPTGFRLESEKIDAKTIVHNYGHGGAGWSLCWGTGHFAAELATAAGEQEYAVLGSGIVGLATARLLQRRGKSVTIYARELPNRVTSNFATAGWSPTSTLCDPAKISPEFRVIFEKSARLAHRTWQDFISLPGYGVHPVESIRVREKPPEPGERGGGEGSSHDPNFYGNLIHDILPKIVALTPDQHALPFASVTLSGRIQYEVHTFLNATQRDFLAHGGKYVIREFKSMDDVLGLRETTIVNCLGIGSKQVFDDASLTPIRGQMTILAPQRDLIYGVGFEGFNAVPRYDGVAIGNTMIPGEWSTVPDLAESKRVVDGLRATIDKVRLRS